MFSKSRCKDMFTLSTMVDKYVVRFDYLPATKRLPAKARVLVFMMDKKEPFEGDEAVTMAGELVPVEFWPAFAVSLWENRHRGNSQERLF